MKILVLSDSHSSLRFMCKCITMIKPDAVIHLGDHYDDAEAVAEQFPHLVFHQVKGNCDTYRCRMNTPEVLCYDVCGVRLYMTHGHRHMVKSGIGGLLADARAWDAQAALYGHTHVADCHREPDGLWVLNPGSCGRSDGSVGLIETEGNTITACRIIRQAEMEDGL